MREWIEILLRSIGLFILTFALIRLLGKRQLLRMTPFHFVTYTAMGILAIFMAVGLIKNLIFGFLTLGTWFVLIIAVDYLAVKSKQFHDFFHGREMVLIQHGKIMEESLNKQRLTAEELLRELRSKNAFNLADVEFAVMEATGEINILLKADKKPVTPYDLGNKVAPQSEPQTVILDGNIVDEALRNIGLSRGWLTAQLEGMGLSLDNIFVGQVDSSGDLYVDVFGDNIDLPKPKVKELLYATLQKAQSDLTTFALDTENETAKEVYGKDAQKLDEVIKLLEPYLTR